MDDTTFADKDALGKGGGHTKIKLQDSKRTSYIRN